MEEDKLDFSEIGRRVERGERERELSSPLCDIVH